MFAACLIFLLRQQIQLVEQSIHYKTGNNQQ